ncbi:GNAT family N-acetyltransferase [Akkermansiaceae bacterium]|nr:GNAT family N-acetyltransferase [Akkermansiaceae bacterium]
MIRRIKIGEVELYRRVRLASLRDSPEAFCSSYEEALSRSEGSWSEQVESSASGSDRAIFVAMEDEPVGLAALYRDEKDSEVGELIQVWIAPEKRGGPVAAELLNEIFKWAAANKFFRVNAEVLAGNSRALRFYKKCGFVQSSNEGTLSNSGILLMREVERI